MKERIAQTIMDHFAENFASVGYCIPERWIIHTLRESLNPKEQLEIEAAITDLESQGFITVGRHARMLNLALTPAGYDAIYPSDPEAAKQKIRQAIMEGFSNRSARVGHCLDERWIIQKLVPNLNPKERELLNTTIGEMAEQELITIGKSMGMATLGLTQKGFDAIY